MKGLHKGSDYFAPNNYCLNSMTEGSIWGKVSDWAEINKVSQGTKVEYKGNHMDWDAEGVWAVFHTDGINYFIRID